MTAHRLVRTAAVACLLAPIVLGAFGAPAHARIRVDVTRSPGFDLGSYQTFAWEVEPERQEDDPLAPGGELDRLYKEVVGARLAKLGLRPAEPGETPDLIVRWVVYIEDVLASEGTWDQYENWAVPVDPVGLSGTRGIVIVELVDAAAGDVVWTGRARSSAGSPQKLQKKARSMLERLIANLK